MNYFSPPNCDFFRISVLINGTIGWLLISFNRKSGNNLKYSLSLTFVYLPFQFYHLNCFHSFPLTSISIVTALIYSTSILVWRVWTPLNDCNNLLTALLSNKQAHIILLRLALLYSIDVAFLTYWSQDLPPTKRLQLILLQWSRTKPTISLRYVCIYFSFIHLFTNVNGVFTCARLPMCQAL